MNPWSTACLDWETRILAGQPLVPDLPLFTEEAGKALRVFRRLRIPDVIGQPTMAEACGDWYFPIVAAMFGSYDTATNRRMIQEYFLLIPKKNSKSSNGGALMLTAVIVNRRPEAEFNLIAPTIQIANIAFRQAVNTIKLDPELEKLFQVQRHVRTITHRLTGATLQIKAADTDVITGGKAVGTMIDETHVFSKKSNAADIFVELRGALAARPDGFLFQTTTQSKDPPSGVFKSELQNARDVRDGLLDLPMLPILYEFPESVLEHDAWKKRRFWKVVNPNLGRSVDETFLQNELMKAEREGIEQLILFASQHFNIEIGLRMRNDAWAGSKYWLQAADNTISIAAIIERCDVAVAGIDGGGLDDLLGLSVIGRDRETREWLIWNHAWAHDDVFQQRKEIVSLLEDFIKEGSLTLCEDPTQDVREVADIIQQLHDADLLPKENGVGFDPFGVSAMVDELAERKIYTAEHGGPVVAVSQGFRLSSAVWGMERKLKDGTLWHAGQALMTWCVGNAKAEQKGNAVLITKQTAGKAKIDPLIATFNAFSLMARNPEAAQQTSVYEERDVRMI